MNVRRQVRLQEWDRIDPVGDSPLRGVYLDPQRSVRETADRLSKTRMLEIEELRHGLRIRSFSFVGRVTLGNLEITIQPKIEGLPLLTLLRYAFGLRDLTLLNHSRFDSDSATFQDLVVAQLVAESTELVSRGLRRQYCRESADLASPRGRIDLDKIATTSEAKRTRLPCLYIPRREDWLPNQLLRAGLDLGSRIATDQSLRVQSRRLSMALSDNVSLRRLDRTAIAEWNRIKNRQTRAYEPAIALVELLMAGRGVSLERDARDLALNGYLFDMNRFFQALLSRCLREFLTGFTVRDEHQLRRMMAYVPGRNPQRRRHPSPRPDFAILKNGKVEKLLDAKYRDLWNQPLPREMLYQLAIYSLSQSTQREAVILYPAIGPAADAVIEIRDPAMHAPPAFVTQRPVQLVQLAELIANRKGAGFRELQQVVRRWVGLE